mgnify:CR=1 FL=1
MTTHGSVIDLDTLNEMKDTMGAEFVGELIDAYCQETPQLIAALQKALAQGQANDFQHAAHSIKSTSASLGALQFSAAARELEMVGRGSSLEGVAPAVERLVADYEQVQSCLQEWRREG